MKKKQTLLDLLEKSNEEIDYYLEDVKVDQFKKDIVELVKTNLDKEIILETINKLRTLL